MLSTSLSREIPFVLAVELIRVRAVLLMTQVLRMRDPSSPVFAPAVSIDKSVNSDVWRKAVVRTSSIAFAVTFDVFLS
jgi:hypothetical protein